MIAHTINLVICRSLHLSVGMDGLCVGLNNFPNKKEIKQMKEKYCKKKNNGKINIGCCTHIIKSRERVKY